jgi:hypothetical protein
MPPRVQGHFALRLYRTTGQKEYLNAIGFYYLALKKSFSHDVRSIDSTGYVETISRRLLAKNTGSPKKAARSQALKPYLPLLFARRFLDKAYQIHELGMPPENSKSDYKQALDYLSKISFRDFLLDENVIRYDTARTVNTVYFLQLLGIADLELPVTEKFKTIFMETDDRKLDPVQYENKLYGLTHFMIAGSGYYQTEVSAEKYGWILDYFKNHIDEIIARSKMDVVAEVGLCFKLSGQKNHPVVLKTRRRVLELLKNQPLLASSGRENTDLERYEHRQVVAYLLLKDFTALYPGPRLADFSELKYLRN